MAVVNDASALFKEIYADGAIKAVPQFAKIMKKVPFSKKEKLGDKYVVPVVLAHEHGFSYGADGAGAFTLNAAVAGTIKRAEIAGAMIVLRTQLSYEDVFKAASGGPAAFESATSLVVDNMQRSFAKRQELAFIYGQKGIGEVLSIDTGVITLTDASWAPGIWSGMKDAILAAYTTQAASATQHDTDLTVTAVSHSAKTVTVSGTSTAVAAGDHLYFKGSRTTTAHNECAGLDAIYTNTGTLFNIAANTYELWKANTRAVNEAMSMRHALNGISDAVNMGLMENAWLIMSSRRWNELNADQAALRRHGTEASEQVENGSKAIRYYSDNGYTDIECHPFVKEGEAFLIPNPAKRLLRVGASDITFRRPGSDENIFRELVDNAGFELRAFADQAIMLQIPAHGTKYTGISD